MLRYDDYVRGLAIVGQSLRKKQGSKEKLKTVVKFWSLYVLYMYMYV